MSDTPVSETTASGLEAVSLGGDALVGMATLGKTAAALALVLAIIFVASALLKRLQLHRQPTGGRLRVISAAAVGPRERVVIVQVEERWLVLGVGGGQVNKLHEMAAPPQESGAPPSGAGFEPGDSFATRFAKALRHNAGLKERAGVGRGKS
ncbi:flagellar biosynthetic protein FliO [Halomonas mongoliensis]|uniref:Flagellar protein n=1 Tax=Halomonas mongoliensis TaxID=321265 RepID=A0ABU1GMV4_9GAMM|nr:flagellar biosynthetic protein FliO [Halomonas mongoliensis]MDR5893354.1 flagellar biosynthetic protein FliO [Halomonas mongoliensis]